MKVKKRRRQKFIQPKKQRGPIVSFILDTFFVIFSLIAIYAGILTVVLIAYFIYT